MKIFFATAYSNKLNGLFMLLLLTSAASACKSDEKLDEPAQLSNAPWLRAPTIRTEVVPPTPTPAQSTPQTEETLLPPKPLASDSGAKGPDAAANTDASRKVTQDNTGTPGTQEQEVVKNNEPPQAAPAVVIDGDTLVLVPAEEQAKDPAVSEGGGSQKAEGPASGAEKEAPRRIPEDADLPDIDGALKVSEASDHENIEGVFIGKWVQVSDGNEPDFAEGGYSASEVQFKTNGTVVLRRSFGKDGGIVLVRKTDFQKIEGNILLIGKDNPFDEDELIREEFSLTTDDKGEKVRIIPAKDQLPLKFEVEVIENKIVMDKKVYERKKEKKVEDK